MGNERAAPQSADANEEAALEIWRKIYPRDVLDKKKASENSEAPFLTVLPAITR